MEEVIGFVKGCYDMRSGYVHRGEKGIVVGLTERFEGLFRIARAVLGAACFARLQPWCQHKDARDTWVKRIDILRAKYAAGLPLEQTEREEFGLEHIRLRTGELVSVFLELTTKKQQYHFAEEGDGAGISWVADPGSRRRSAALETQ